jgi:formate/nitrite transporter FocA (FNT family)
VPALGAAKVPFFGAVTWFTFGAEMLPALVGFILDATTASFLPDLLLVVLLDAELFTSDFLMTAIGLFLECLDLKFAPAFCLIALWEPNFKEASYFL